MSSCPGALGWLGLPCESRTFSLRNFSKSSFDVPPARKMTTFEPVTSMMVDSTPTAQGPPSKIMSTLSPRLSNTCCAVVGLMDLNLLAEGATIGTPLFLMRSRATGCAGMRTAMLGRPEQARSIAALLSLRLSTMVSGPGQNFRARAIMRSSVRA